MATKQAPAVAEIALIAVGFIAAAVSTVAYSVVLWGTRGALHVTGLDRAARPAV